MLVRTWLLSAVWVAASCEYPALPPLTVDGATDIANPGEANLTINAAPAAFTMHVGDSRLTTITVTNTGGQMSSTPSLAVSGITHGTLSFSVNTCTGGLAPNASCTAIGTVMATSAGQVMFQVTATGTPGGVAMAQMGLTVRDACAATCGTSGTVNCCGSSIVPGNSTNATMAGASFYRTYDATSAYGDMSYPATVSDFRLDTYEVTVGRYRAYVDAGMGIASAAPAPGDGAHAKITGSGWDASWNNTLPADATTLKTNLKCQTAYQTWTDTAGSNENMPINCLTWYEAFAFCIWDGGYLPTELEWNYAASAGSEQRAFSWSSPPTSTAIDCSYANYKLDTPPGTYCVGTTGAASLVGSVSPKGDGKFGQADLTGNVWEWNLDWYGAYSATCDDCANLSPTLNRILHGGSWLFNATYARTGFRDQLAPATRSGNIGFRCARTP